MRQFTTIFALLLLLPLACPAAEPDLRGQWKCTALDPQTIVLTGDYFQLQRELFQKRFQERRRQAGGLLAKWAQESTFRISATEAIAQYRPAVTASLLNSPKIAIVTADGSSVGIAKTGYWLNPVGQSRFPDKDGKERFTNTADALHFLYVQLERPLANGEKLTVTMPAGEKTAFTYEASTPSPLFKINQVGYVPAARKKYAYLGAWLGTAGPLPLHERLDGKPFDLIDATSGEKVFTGTMRKRLADPVNDHGTPFTGEEVLELDFSSVSQPGKYYLQAEGVGRSEEFAISDLSMAESFYIHARGLYHQRCGIAREKPYTNWTAPACHQQCVRGTFPPDITHYGKGDDKRPYGFHTLDSKSIEVNHFLLIEQNIPSYTELLDAPGGWHDAADWDRRPQHLGIVGDLAAVYLLKPDNFCDGQLNIPESGNGIPDILDEALWGIDHLRRKQQEDGGVGSWIETTRHPTSADGGAFDDKLVYYQSCATRNSTLEYACYASELSLALRRAGAREKAEELCQSAEKAWNFAVHSKPPRAKNFYYNEKLVRYLEEPTLAPEMLVKAGLNLYLLTDDRTYLNAAEDAATDAENVMKKDAWRWSPLFWIELEICRYKSIALDSLRVKRQKSIVHKAESMLGQLENNYPVRIAWYGPQEGWVHTMGMGTFHPLRQARYLIAAHAMTRDKTYLDAAYLAYDFHNGANPSGSTLTSGLGKTYPVTFLHLDSYADGIAEYIPGITPYRNPYKIPRNAVKMAYGLYYREHSKLQFPGLNLSLLPKAGLDEDTCSREISKLLPIWHRWCNIESETVGASEFTVWETIAPAAAVTGYLLNQASKPEEAWLNRQPATDIRDLPGYYCLP